MFPLPAATTTLANTKPTAEAIFGAFSPYAWAEIGVVSAALLVSFIIWFFWDIITNFLMGKSGATRHYDWTDDMKQKGLAPKRTFNSKTSKFD